MQSKINGVLIAVSTILLSLFGILMIYSASSYSSYLQYSDSFFYVKKQAIAFVIGLVLMLIGSKINLEILKKLSIPIYIISVVLLALVFIPGVGVSSYGATRWINLGVTTFQPSEISKFGLMFLLSALMSKNQPNKLSKLIIPLLCSLLICALVIIEPNMSITLCIAMCVLIMLYVAGVPKKWFYLFIAIGLIAIPILIIKEPYRLKRLMAFVNPWLNPKDEGYQLIQSYYALGGGGLFGVGLFNSRQKFLFLPFAESDFIFSIIGEELGFVGALMTMLVFAILIFSGIRVAKQSNNFYHTLLATGIVGIISIQTLINIAVVIGAIPPTGLPLPFISAGGTSLIVFMFVSGILINIDSVTKKVRIP